MISVSNVIRSLWLNHWSLSHLFLVSIWPRSPFAVPPAPRLPLQSKNLPDKGLCHRQGRHSLCHRPSLRQMLGIRNERTLLVLHLLSISICLCLQDTGCFFLLVRPKKMMKCQITCKSLQKSPKCQNFLRFVFRADQSKKPPCIIS